MHPDMCLTIHFINVYIFKLFKNSFKTRSPNTVESYTRIIYTQPNPFMEPLLESVNDPRLKTNVAIWPEIRLQR